MLKRIFTAVLFATTLSISCQKTDSVEQDIADLQDRVAKLETAVSETNAKISEVYTLMKASTVIVGVTHSEHGYTLELSDGSKLEVTDGASINYTAPVIGIDASGYWIMSTDGGATFNRLTGSDGNPICAYPDNGETGDQGSSGITPSVRTDKNGYWQISYDNGTTYTYIYDSNGKMVSALAAPEDAVSGFFESVVYDSTQKTLTVKLLTGATLALPVLSDFGIEIAGADTALSFVAGETRSFAVTQTQVKEAVIRTPQGWKAVLSSDKIDITAPETDSEGVISILVTSPKGYLRTIQLQVASTTFCKTWMDFDRNTADNLLVDFSYAGYKHGEQAIPEVSTLGYTTFNICDYGAVANDGKSDRAAFIAAAAAVKAAGKGILYIPEGTFDLHNADDVSESIIITTGNLILKGASREKSILRMAAANQPTDASILYSSPVTIIIKHNSTLSELAGITADAAQGAFSVEVGSTTGIAAGDWVCLRLQNNNEELLQQELGAYRSNLTGTSMDIITNGIQIWDYHQVKSVSGSKVTFYEPLMHAVESRWGWTICKYPHYEGVGVEDLTFEGNAKDDFTHHGTWEDDGAYKPINLMRVTDSWMRRVTFRSVSEASSIVNSANVSVYDIRIEGNRGHAAIRSQCSSRVFLGDITDCTNSKTQNNVGQWHAAGVSKQSMGTVLWRNTWGTDGCFESHATQPRWTLVDCCTGALLQLRQGGDAAQMPNHMEGLVLWNMNATNSDGLTNFQWWNFSSQWWKFMPVTVVGYHGATTQFDPTQVLSDEFHGQAAQPESLYEAQLKRRLGTLPAWLNALK